MTRNKRKKYYPAQKRHASTETGRTLIFHKPYKVLSSFTDPEGRPTVGSYVHVPNVYAAGRLDFDSEGLLLLTSDGGLAHRITHPRYKLPKIYWVQVEHLPAETALRELRRGVLVQGKKTQPAQAEILPAPPPVFPRSEPIRARKTVPTAWLKVTLREGRKRQIRKMTAAVGHPTLRLVRVAIGPIQLGNLEPGQWRDLTAAELKKLHLALKNQP